MALNVYFKGMWHIWGRRVFLGKPEGKRPIGRLRHRWEDNIKIIFNK